MNIKNFSNKVAFDVDGTLIHQIGEKSDTPRYDIIQIFNSFFNLGCTMYIWSGGGIEYAERWRDKLGLIANVIPKVKNLDIDIAFDDEEVNLGKVNIRV